MVTYLSQFFQETDAKLSQNQRWDLGNREDLGGFVIGLSGGGYSRLASVVGDLRSTGRYTRSENTTVSVQMTPVRKP